MEKEGVGKGCGSQAWLGKAGVGERPVGLAGIWIRPSNALPGEVAWAVIQIGRLIE